MRKYLKIILGSIVSVLLLILLFSQMDFNYFLTLLKNIKFSYLLLGFVSYFIMNVFRSMRFYILLKKKIGFSKITNIVFLHNFFNNILPLRTGELSFFWFMKKKKIDFPKSFSSLAISRFMDFISILLIFFMTLIFLSDIPFQIMLFRDVLLIFLFLILTSIIVLVPLSKKIIKKFKFNFKAIRKILHNLDKIDKEIKKTSKKQLFLTFILSLFIWISSFFVFYIIIKGAQIKLSLAFIIIAATLAIFSTLLPIQGILQLGTVEGAWALGLIILGAPKQIAIYTGFLTHFVRILYFTLLGAFGYWRYKDD